MSAATHFNNDLRYRHAEHPEQTAFTPLYVLSAVRSAFGGSIELDPCTTIDNPVSAERFYAPPMDGLVESWDARSIFVNPPYGKAREAWVVRCLEAAKKGSAVVLLMPAASDTRTFQRAAGAADAVVFVRGRLKFGTLRPNRRQAAASHPSALFVYNAPSDALAHLGMTMTSALLFAGAA